MPDIDLKANLPYTELLSVLVEIDTAIDSTEITMRQVQALVLIAREPPMTFQPFQVREILDIPKSAVTRMLQTLIGHKLVIAKTPVRDLRRRMLEITPKGISLVNKIEKIMIGSKQA